MKRLILTASLALLTIVTPAAAQQAGNNINVLPVFSDPSDPQFFLKGDGYLQRQVEPTIAASTRNPDHLLSFFNDYRAVDVGDDTGIGEGERIALFFNTARLVMMASLQPFQIPKISLPPMAAAEAWVGMSRSYDGGLTWSGGFLPGSPFDDSSASLAAPIKGLEAATDPVVVPGPCGTFYLVFVAFTRGDQSKMVVARYEDLNNDEAGDPIFYRYMTVIETGNNAENGFFLDKPHINLDLWRGPGAEDECSHRVYVSYSTFNGFSQDGKIQSKMNFAVSEDEGLSFSKQKINKNFNQNQGSVIAIDPRGGEPGDPDGGGTVYVFWRHFFKPDTILMTKSTDYGANWDNPKSIVGPGSIAAFDQPTISSSTVNDPEWLTARSNGFPTATVTADGRVFAAWQEKVNIEVAETDPKFGKPDELGSPRIVLTESTDGGKNWSDREAADFGDRTDPFDPRIPLEPDAPQPQPRASGPQIQPDLSFAGGRLLLAYLESRGLIVVDPGTGDESVNPVDLSLSEYISGYRRVMDVRVAALNPGDGSFISSKQVSRYPIHVGADLSDGQDLADVAAVNYPCSQETGDLLDPPCTRQVNRFNIPQSGAGTAPFMGDYIDLVPTLQFVRDGSEWRWATLPGDTPYQGFHAVWADNRHLSPPTYPAEDPEYLRYPEYGPPGIDGACFNPGSRNTDVLTAKVDASLIVSTPTTYKQLGARRGFPLSLRNPTDITRYYELKITTGNQYATFSVDPLGPAGDVKQGNVEIFAYSGISQVVYVENFATGPVRVEVRETDLNGNLIDGGQFGVVTLNADPNNPPVQNLDPNENLEPTIGDAFVINPVPESAFVINDAEGNAFVINPFVDNAFVINSTADNAFVINAFVINAFVINAFVINTPIYDVIDTVWEVKANSDDTASSFLPLINIDNAEQFLGNYAFQLIVNKNSSYGAYLGNDEVCADLAAEAIQQQQVVSNVSQSTKDIDNAFVINPAPENAFVINPFPENAFVINSTFAMAPSEAQVQTKSAVDTNDGTLKAPPASNSYTVTLRAYQLVADPGQFTFNPDAEFGGDEPALSLIPTTCTTDECIVSNAADLVPEGVATLDTTNIEDPETGRITVRVGDSFTFPGGWILRNQGKSDAKAEVRTLRHGFFISKYEAISLQPLSDEPIVDSDLPEGEQARRIGFVPSASNTVAGTDNEVGGGTEEIGPASLTIPDLVLPGDYKLVVFVDDWREVSEKNEPNNQYVLDITIIDPNRAPEADNQTLSTPEDTPKDITLTGSDADGDVLTFEVTVEPTKGTLEGDAPNLTYTPNANYFGSDSFSFKVNDGKVNSVVDGVVSITVDPVNDLPVITGSLNFTVAEDVALTAVIPVEDVDNDPLTFEITTGPSNGTAILTGEGGEFTYTPAANFNGTDGFTVKISDTVDSSIDATVSIEVTAVNDAPVAVDDEIEVFENSGPNAVNVLSNDSDPEFDPIFVSSVVQAANGTVAIGLDGQFVTYRPDDNFIGVDSFAYEISDNVGGVAVADVEVTVADLGPNWGFEGLAKPWRPNYSANAGSAIPLSWYYFDPDTGSKVASNMEDTQIRITGPWICGTGEDDEAVEFVNDPGSSDLRYVSGDWQFNWDTVGLVEGCYNVRIYHPFTGQVNGPFQIRLK